MCSKKYPTSEKLAVHKKSNCKKKYRCDLCGEYFRFEKDMMEHYEKVHN